MLIIGAVLVDALAARLKTGIHDLTLIEKGGGFGVPVLESLPGSILRYRILCVFADARGNGLSQAEVH